MRRPRVNARFARLVVAAALSTASASSLRAQSSASPIRHALFLALGGDPASGTDYSGAPLAVSAGWERGRVGSRWSMRLAADYRRQSSDGAYGSSRSEDFGVNLTARYGRASGAIRPYLLGGAGIADLRTRVRDARYYIDPESSLFPPVSYDNSRWNGLLTTGLGTDVTVGRVRLFTEARLNVYPGSLTTKQHSHFMLTRKALYLGIRF